jgi:hypothetical protein
LRKGSFKKIQSYSDVLLMETAGISAILIRAEFDYSNLREHEGKGATEKI